MLLGGYGDLEDDSAEAHCSQCFDDGDRDEYVARNLAALPRCCVRRAGAFQLSAPTRDEIQGLVERIGERIGRHLERRGLLAPDAENSHLNFEPGEADGLADLQGHSITYRIALGAHRGRKAFSLQSLPPSSSLQSTERVGQLAGFSLHAGVAAEDLQRDKLERLCRYISRPAVSTERLSRLSDGRIRYALKTPYRDGTTHVVFEPLDFSGAARRAGAKPRGEPDALPRRICAESSAPCADRPEPARPGWGGSSRLGGTDPEARGDALGAAPETGVRHRDRTMR